MELTTSFQKIATGQTKQFGGSTGKLELWAKYNTQDITNNRTNVTVELRLVCSSYIGNYQATYWGISGDLSNSGNLGSGEYYSRTLGSATGNITHNIDGTKTVSFSGYFNPTAWNMSISVSGSATLPNLHKPPEIETADMVETNATMTALNIPDTTIVRHLSKKTITLHATPYDEATIDKYRLRHFNTNYDIPSSTTFQNGNVFTNVDYTTHDILIDDEFKASIIQDIGDSLNGLSTDWVYVSVGGTIQKPDAIPYFKPTLVGTSTTIKRKSGSGTNLTDNKVSLNLAGTIYKENDIIGNDNAITEIGYKIWDTTSSEPANYTSLTPTISGGDVTISDFEISNILFTKVYNYKIYLKDKYYDTYVEGTVPLGQALWSEYKDRVDFLKITKQGKELYPNIYSTSEEIIVGEWIDGRPIYRKVLTGTTGNSAGDMSLPHNISNLDKFIKIEGFTTDNDQRFFPNFYRDFNSQYVLIVYLANPTNIMISYGSSRTNKDFYLIAEYIKTTD